MGHGHLDSTGPPAADSGEENQDSLARPGRLDLGRSAHWLARIVALDGRPHDAIRELSRAVNAGWSGWFDRYGVLLHEKPAFAPLRDAPGFRRFLESKDIGR